MRFCSSWWLGLGPTNDLLVDGDLFGCSIKSMKSLCLSAVTILMLVGCADEPNVRYVDPGAMSSRVAGTGVESQDIIAAAQKAAESLLNVPAITSARKPPVILITPVTNRSSSPIDTNLYTTKVRGTLMQYASGRVVFLARDASSVVNEREQQLRESGAVERGATGNAGRVAKTYDYILTAELQGLATATSKGQSDYFLVAFKLIDFQDVLVWENQYEIKKEGRESAVYR
jgi:PBP1b-binding outer membrane lipoprotein LpoB